MALKTMAKMMTMIMRVMVVVAAAIITVGTTMRVKTIKTNKNTFVMLKTQRRKSKQRQNMKKVYIEINVRIIRKG